MKFKIGDELVHTKALGLKVIILDIQHLNYYGNHYTLRLIDNYLHHAKGLTYTMTEESLHNEFKMLKPKEMGRHFPEWW